VDGAKYNYGPAPPDILDRVSRIAAICQAHGVRLIEAALQFVLGHPVVKTVIPGANSAEQVRANLALVGTKIPSTLWADLKDQKLVRRDAPIDS
jgi:D-threo-aldose 1-dehydrogenase